MTTTPLAPPVRTHIPPAIAVERRLHPVKAWAFVGAVVIALWIYVFGSWILSGDPKRTPTGADPVPGWMMLVGQIWVACGLVAFVAAIYLLLIRPWRREGHITLDGMFCIAYMSMYLQDTMLNFFKTWYSYNSMFLNWGGWDHRIPGWLAPLGNLQPEPFLYVWPMYVYLIFVPVIGGCWLMRKIKERRPTISRFGLMASVFCLAMVFDLLLEPLLMVLGHYSYAGSISWLTIFHGHYYQFPAYEAPMWGAALTAWVSLRHFRDDKNRTFAERGIDELKASPRQKTLLRQVALIGVCNAILFLCYSMPAAISGLYSSPWPDDVLKRSYFTNGLCGPGTSYECGGPDIPIPRRDSSHVSPDNTLVHDSPDPDTWLRP